MGLGGSPTEADDYEWFSLHDAVDAPARSPHTAARWLDENPVWLPLNAQRVLLVDLDNLRASSGRLRLRMELISALAHSADRVAFAGQAGAVARSLPWLRDFADCVLTVDDRVDGADLALLDAAFEAGHHPAGAAGAMQFAVASNDGIFAMLGRHGALIVVSPRASAVNQQLRHAAHHVVDLGRYDRAAADAPDAGRQSIR